MKHFEVYDKHADRRKGVGKQKKKLNEHDKWDRKARVSFKNYVKQLRDSELENDDGDYDSDEIK